MSHSQVTFTLSESLAKEEGERLGLEIPRQHRLLTQDISSQSLATFSEDSSTGEDFYSFPSPLRMNWTVADFNDI